MVRLFSTVTSLCLHIKLCKSGIIALYVYYIAICVSKVSKIKCPALSVPQNGKWWLAEGTVLFYAWQCSPTLTGQLHGCCLLRHFCWSQVLPRGIQWKEERQWPQTGTEEIPFKYNKNLQGRLNTWARSLERLCSLCLWRYSNPSWAWSWVASSSWPFSELGDWTRQSLEMPCNLSKSAVLRFAWVVPNWVHLRFLSRAGGDSAAHLQAQPWAQLGLCPCAGSSASVPWDTRLGLV